MRWQSKLKEDARRAKSADKRAARQARRQLKRTAKDLAAQKQANNVRW